MVNIRIEAPEHPMEVHRTLSERIIRAVADTYQCEEAEILLAIVVKPLFFAAGDRADTALGRDTSPSGNGAEGSDRHVRAIKIAGNI